MKYLGIDVGTKYIGLATSDEGGSLAFPASVVTSADAKQAILAIIADQGIEAVVVGYSLDQAGKENAVAEKARRFIEGLSIGLPVHWQDERFSSLEASRHLFDNRPIANPRRKEKNTGRDDHAAAALILQRFLDKQ
jgi:putative Holliday junction resolvase